LRSAGLKLPCPMMALKADAESPAQFAFDLGALGVAEDVFSFVVSGAASWVELGTEATTAAVLRQARSAFPGAFQGAADGSAASVVVHVATERRATFACVPGLQRPTGVIAAGLWATGDYVAGPYPATIEGAVRSGNAAAQGIAWAAADDTELVPPSATRLPA
jgi:predicted NAD/FAD-dependent oxidoreductase